MDLQKELKEIGNERWSAQVIVNRMESEKKELERKLHLFKIISLVGKIEKAFSDDLFKNDNIQSLHINCQFDYDRGYIVKFQLKDFEGEFVSKYNQMGQFVKSSKLFYNLFEEIAGFNKELANEKLGENVTHAFELNPGLEEKLLDLFLSSELQKILNYNQIQLSSPVNENPGSRKIKL